MVMPFQRTKDVRISGQEQRSCAGFSLVELLITLALILIMSVMLYGRGSRSYQHRQLAACEKNLQSIYVALNIYAADNKDFYPAVTGAGTAEAPLSLLVPRCTTGTEIFICPGTKDGPLPQGEPFPQRKISYAYYMGLKSNPSANQPLISDRQIDTSRKSKGRPVFSADGKGDGANHDKYGGNVLFGDGRVETYTTAAEADLMYPTNVVLLNPK